VNWIPVAIAGATQPAAPLIIEDTRVSNQEIDVTLAGNLNIGTIFTGSVSASDVGYWLDAMAYSDQYENAPGPNGLVLGNRFGYGLRVLFRVRQLSGKANLNYGLIGASVDAGFAQAVGTSAAPPQLPIGHVTVGPSASKALNVVSVRMLLDRFGYTGIPVEASKTSFRS
jgi:hypothetical protein